MVCDVCLYESIWHFIRHQTPFTNPLLRKLHRQMRQEEENEVVENEHEVDVLMYIYGQSALSRDSVLVGKEMYSQGGRRRMGVFTKYTVTDNDTHNPSKGKVHWHNLRQDITSFESRHPFFHHVYS